MKDSANIIKLSLLIIGVFFIGYVFGTKHSNSNEKDPCSSKINNLQSKIDSLSKLRSAIPYNYTESERSDFFDNYLKLREGKSR